MLADLTLVLSIVSQILPFGGALLVIAVVPMAAIAARNRLRAVVAGTVAASAVGFLVLGTPVVTSVVACGALGAVVGDSARDAGSGSRARSGNAALFLWPVVAIVVDLLLLVFSAYRKLLLVQIRNAWSGVSRVLRQHARRADRDRRGSRRPARRATAAGLVADDPGRAAGRDRRRGARWRSGSPRRRCTGCAPRSRPRPAPSTAATSTTAIARRDGRRPMPVPVALRAVGFRYPGRGDRRAARRLARRSPRASWSRSSGRTDRASRRSRASSRAGADVGRGRRVPGRPGSARSGGTAIVFQRPELQVLGVRVRDDVVWGLASRRRVDVDALLDRVGLRSFADRETSTLSGGELQRLAVAAALARRPQLLISDESTAMVDAAGRAQLVALLRSLVTHDGMAVVHVTHRRVGERAAADRTIALEAGRVVPVPAADRAADPDAARRPTPVPRRRVRLFILRDVGHVYSRNTPWAHRALTDVNLRIDRGEALLVVGHNGSGKSTLAWILAGLLDPSEGEARIEGRPLRSVVGQVGVAFQHARLQLLRPTVAAEVSAASGAAPVASRGRSLADVGLRSARRSGRVASTS